VDHYVNNWHLALGCFAGDCDHWKFAPEMSTPLRSDLFDSKETRYKASVQSGQIRRNSRTSSIIAAAPSAYICMIQAGHPGRGMDRDSTSGHPDAATHQPAQSDPGNHSR